MTSWDSDAREAGDLAAEVQGRPGVLGDLGHTRTEERARQEILTGPDHSLA